MKAWARTSFTSRERGHHHVPFNETANVVLDYFAHGKRLDLWRSLSGFTLYSSIFGRVLATSQHREERKGHECPQCYICEQFLWYCQKEFYAVGVERRETICVQSELTITNALWPSVCWIVASKRGTYCSLKDYTPYLFLLARSCSSDEKDRRSADRVVYLYVAWKWRWIKISQDAPGSAP